MTKPILLLDFDGVCHSYTSGWQGADVIPDPPVPGLFEFLTKATDEFEVHVLSSRTHPPGGRAAMEQWFRRYHQEWFATNGVEVKKSWDELGIQFPMEKTAAKVSLDDRALTFTGVWPSIQSLKEFQPWNRKKGQPM